MTDTIYKCPHCNQHLEVPDELLGQTADCPSCKTNIALPLPVAQSHIMSPHASSQPPPIPIQQASGSCPLCGRTKPMKKAKELYGQKICKKCYYGFANRRNFAFVVDILIWNIMFVLYAILIGGYGDLDELNLWFISLALFGLKDGFSGHSPGKAIFGVQTMMETTGQPAGFLAAFMRNLPLCIPLMPIVVSSQLLKGHRTGDGWSNTKVIWKKYKDHPIFAVVSNE